MNYRCGCWCWFYYCRWCSHCCYAEISVLSKISKICKHLFTAAIFKLWQLNLRMFWFKVFTCNLLMLNALIRLWASILLQYWQLTWWTLKDKYISKVTYIFLLPGLTFLNFFRILYQFTLCPCSFHKQKLILTLEGQRHPSFMFFTVMKSVLYVKL